MSVGQPGERVRFFVTAGLAVAVALNAAALLVMLNRLSDGGPVPNLVKGLAIWLWSAGVLASAVGWLAASLSARAFSRDREPAGQTWAWLAGLAISVAIGCFVWGCWIVGHALTMSPD